MPTVLDLVNFWLTQGENAACVVIGTGLAEL